MLLRFHERGSSHNVLFELQVWCRCSFFFFFTPHAGSAVFAKYFQR